MKSVLVLGAGLVTRPLVRYLLDSGFTVTVASRTVSKAERLIDGHARGAAVALLADDTEKLDRLVGEHDLAVSLLPAPLHPVVAKMCIKHKKAMVTTSYVSGAMKELDESARQAGVMILNEIGVDPGIDHMSAMRVIDDVRARGGEIVSFKSYCGGLPAPEANDNPYGYKFSWSPRAVCTAGKNAARYRERGQEVKVPGRELFAQVHYVEVEGLGELEAYPNRDSLIYLDLYGLQSIETMFRGTFRYRGWCETLKAIVDLGLLEETGVTYPSGMTLAEFTTAFLRVATTGDLRKDLSKQLGIEAGSAILDRLEWLGLLSNDPVPITGEETTPLDVLAARMLEKMPYGEGERDMIVLCHYFTAKFPDGEGEEITSTLIDYGRPGGDSSMARTVSLPAAIGVKLILEGKIKKTGVHIPVTPDIYNPVLEELERQEIRCVEATKSLSA